MNRHIRRSIFTILAACTTMTAQAGFEPDQRCVRAENDYTYEAAGDSAADDKIAPRIPTKSPPRADEVGPPAQKGETQQLITPQPSLPIETRYDSIGWIRQGPGATKDGDLNIAPLHPTAGCVTAIAPHPTNESIIYIGTANGGVWKTTNALATNLRWTPLTDNQLSLSIGGLTLDPTDASGNTLVAGFGRRSSFGQGGALKGLIRTTDGGATWTPLGTVDLAERNIYNLVARGSLILVDADGGTSPGLYRSTDTGANFTRISGLTGPGLPDAAVTHLVADPSNSSRYYAHVGGNYGIYRSDDSGATWISIFNQLPTFQTAALAVASDGTLFAATLATTSQVYRSTDHGATQTQMDSVTANTGGEGNQTHLFNGFVADPTNNKLVYISGLYTRTQFPFSGRVVRGDASLARGSQWTSIASTDVQGTGTAPHTDSRVLVFTAGGRLLEGDDGGIYELPVANTGSEGTITGSTGSNWRSLNGDLQNCEMHSVAYDALNRIFIGGAQDTGFQEQTQSDLAQAGVAGWDKTRNGDGGEAGVDLLTSPGQSIRYSSAEGFGDFTRATYNANNVQVSSAKPSLTLVGTGTPIDNSPTKTNNMPFTTPMAMNAVAGGRLIIGGNTVHYETTDGGNTVKQIDPFPANGLARIAYGGTFNGVASPDVLFYGVGATVRYRTVANGAISSIAFPGGQNVQGISFNPANWKNAYIIGDTTVYLANDIATNGAASFTNITGNLIGVGHMQSVEYLTLPAGDAVVVGTDLGAYIMQVNVPGIWRTLGNNMPHVPIYSTQFDPVGQVLAVSALGRGAWLYDFKPTKATGQYGETFQNYPDGTTLFPARTGELFSSNLGGTGGGRIVDDNVRYVQFTAYGTPYTRSVFRLPDLDPGKAASAFSAKWNTVVYGNPNTMADGFSFNFGPLGAITQAAFTDTTYNTEDGFNAGLTVSLRTYSGNTPGYYVRFNGAVVANGFVAKDPSAWGTFNFTYHFFEVDWRMDTGLTLKVDGVAVFTNLPVPGFVPSVGDRFVFGARCGQSTETISLDNVAVFTGGVLSPLTGTSPYYFSSQNPFTTAEQADKAFDGNINTKWLALDYTGYIGASLAGSKAIRAYTLSSANDTPARDPSNWDFQTSTDGGTHWKQHGAQGSQYFANRFESRTFVVANPVASTAFRIHITENLSDPNFQLAEFQPWELIPIPPSFVITNTNDSGPGSLREAVVDSANFGTASSITFSPALSGQTITLTSGPIVVSNTVGVTIDSFGLPGGVTISGNNTSRVFTINTGARCSLKNLTLTGGRATGGQTQDDVGGAIFNLGNLIVEKCTLTGNSAASAGGALYSSTSGDFSTSTALYYCTIAGNTAAVGGGIHNDIGLTTMAHCTVSANTAPAGSGGGVSCYGDNFTRTTVGDSIISGNTSDDVAFVLSSANNSFNSSGYNVIGSGNGVGNFNRSGDLLIFRKAA